MTKLTLRSLSLREENILLHNEKKEILGGQSFPCQPRLFCKGTRIACDECAVELPGPECICTLGGL